MIISSSMSIKFASIERPRINPLCSWDTPGATLGSTWRRTALQSILLSVLVMFNGLMLLGEKISAPSARVEEAFLGMKTMMLSLKLSHSSLTRSTLSTRMRSVKASWNAFAAMSRIFRHALNGMPSLPGALLPVSLMALLNVSRGTVSWGRWLL